MNIGLVGRGFVGNAIYENFKSKHNFLVYDHNPAIANVGSLKEVCENTKIIFVALPTPMTEDGQCDTSAIFNTVRVINECDSDNIVVLKSTVVPGTCEKIREIYPNLRIVFSPEFLTEKNSIQDFKECNRVIFGGHQRDTQICKNLFEGMFPNKEYRLTDWRTAEMLKYFLNTFLATKVSFANEMYQVCELLQIDYKEVLDLALLDDRLSESHFQVPGPDGDLGFGGTCFPKDINAIINFCKNRGMSTDILCAVWDKNLKVRSNLDWLEKLGRAIIKKENKDATIKPSDGSHHDGASRVAIK